MCLIAFNWQPQQEMKLVLIANRDEFHARPTRALHWWDWPDGAIAGRDEQAGGTWLAANRAGRFAAITNFRQLDAPVGEYSRGELPLAWIQYAGSAEAFVEILESTKSTYSPFSLLIGDMNENGGSLWLIGTYESAHRIEPGTHALSNHKLDAPWPKAARVVQRLGDHLHASSPPSTGDLFNILNDRQPAPDDELPDTGIGLEMERFLSPPMIVSQRYGTRSASVLQIGPITRMAERSFDSAGNLLGQRQFSWPSTSNKASR
ncbi:MAG: NRDE family protein [Pseudomonadota bacterium]